MASTEISGAVTPLDPNDDRTPVRIPPHNYEAEMALLGALLVNNKAYERVQDHLRPEHFADALHGEIFGVCATLIERGQLADPVTLRNYLGQAEAFAERGGQAYLARLANSVITLHNAQDLGREVYDCFLRRELIDVGATVVDRAFEHDLETTAPDQIEMAEEQLYALAEQGQIEGGLQTFKTAVVSAIEMAEAAYRRDGHLVGVPTGFTDLDRMLGGLHKSDLLIVAARPAMGKTAFATNIAYHAASSLRPGNDKHEYVAYFSLEMSADQLATRILSEHAHVRSDSIRRGDVSEGEFYRILDVSRALHTLPLFIDDTPALTVPALRTRARRLKRQQGLGLIVVDYLQLMQGSAVSRREGRVQEVSEITRGLKAVAKELDVPVLALSQLSRAVEQRDDKRPQLSDLRESGSIEQDADVVMFLYREEYYREREKPTQRDSEIDDKFQERQDRYRKLLAKCRNVAEVILSKQRHGPIGTVNLQFTGEFTRFSDWSDPARQAEDRS